MRRRLRDVLEAGLELRGRRRLVTADQAAAVAVAAVDAAAIDDEEQHAVGVLVDDRRRRVVRVLAERIAQLLVADVGLGRARDRLQADRAARVHRIHQARVVRRDADAEQRRARGEPGALLGRQRRRRARARRRSSACGRAASASRATARRGRRRGGRTDRRRAEAAPYRQLDHGAACSTRRRLLESPSREARPSTSSRPSVSGSAASSASSTKRASRGVAARPRACRRSGARGSRGSRSGSRRRSARRRTRAARPRRRGRSPRGPRARPPARASRRARAVPPGTVHRPSPGGWPRSIRSTRVAVEHERADGDSRVAAARAPVPSAEGFGFAVLDRFFAVPLAPASSAAARREPRSGTAARAGSARGRASSRCTRGGRARSGGARTSSTDRAARAPSDPARSSPDRSRSVRPSRCASRVTWVSTTTPSFLPIALPSTTFAVLRATPGSATSSSIVAGSRRRAARRPRAPSRSGSSPSCGRSRSSGPSSRARPGSACASAPASGYFANSVGRDRVDQLVGRLRRQDRRDEQLVRVLDDRARRARRATLLRARPRSWRAWSQGLLLPRTAARCRCAIPMASHGRPRPYHLLPRLARARARRVQQQPRRSTTRGTRVYDADFAIVYNAALDVDAQPLSEPERQPRSRHASRPRGTRSSTRTTQDDRHGEPADARERAGRQREWRPRRARSLPGMPTRLAYKRYFIRFDVRVVGGRPWRVKVDRPRVRVGSRAPRCRSSCTAMARPHWLAGPHRGARGRDLPQHQAVREAGQGRGAGTSPSRTTCRRPTPRRSRPCPAAAAKVLADDRGYPRRSATTTRCAAQLADDIVWSLGGGTGADVAMATWQADPGAFDAMADAIAAGCAADGDKKAVCPAGAPKAGTYQLTHRAARRHLEGDVVRARRVAADIRSRRCGARAAVAVCERVVPRRGIRRCAVACTTRADAPSCLSSRDRRAYGDAAQESREGHLVEILRRIARARRCVRSEQVRQSQRQR